MKTEILGQSSKVFHHEIQPEITRSLEKWGVQNLDPFKYSAILTEECGEVARAIIDGYNWDKKEWGVKDFTHLREELVQVATVAIMFIQCIDRDEWNR